MGILKRKCSLRDSMRAKIKAEGTTHQWSRNGTLIRKKPIKKQSRSQRERLRLYLPIRRDFLDANVECAICISRGLRPNPATEVHHARGRTGKLLCDPRFFIASCFPCRMWPHDNPNQARELGILAPRAQFGVVPK